MQTAPHLLIPYANAFPPAQGEAAAVAGELPRLRRLLARLAPGPLEAGSLADLSLPHERALARLAHLPDTDGRIPWAAWHLHQAAEAPGAAPWAWITPCHWHVASDHIRMDPPGQLALQEAQSRDLLAAMAPYFAQDGIDLAYESPGRWRARGEIFGALACASLDRVAGRPVDDWLPRGPEARALRRLQQEMQMLLYTHPVNEARERDGLLPVNSFWVSGAGALPEGAAQGLPAHLQVDERLREPALAGQHAAWAERWQEIDAQVLPAWLGALDQGRPVALTLCGARSARTWTSSSPSWWRRAASMLRAPSADAALSPL